MNWQDISTAPKDKTLILVYWGPFNPDVAYELVYWDTDCWMDHHAEFGGFYNSPTHWMPLPEPPR